MYKQSGIVVCDIPTYRAFLQDVLCVLTDTSHKSGFKLQYLGPTSEILLSTLAMGR